MHNLSSYGRNTPFHLWKNSVKLLNFKPKIHHEGSKVHQNGSQIWNRNEKFCQKQLKKAESKREQIS